MRGKRAHLWAVGSEPWASEPDREEWTSAGGSRCVVRRLDMGCWAGYVAVSLGHPWHGLTLGEVPAVVHGGCTHSGPLIPVEASSQWWIGFDCCHGGDLVPRLWELMGRAGLAGFQYRDLDYVRRETNELAAQAEVAARGATRAHGGDA